MPFIENEEFNNEVIKENVEKLVQLNEKIEGFKEMVSKVDFK